MRLFRPANEASARWNLTKTAVQTVVFWGGLLGAVPLGIHAAEGMLGLPGFEAGVGAGVSLLLLASAGGVWSGWTMAVRGKGTPLPLDAARQLVVSGPYAWVRNPMAVTGLSQGLGVGLLIGSWGVVAYVIAGGLLWHFGVRPAEEADLEKRFGAAYRSYRSRVGLWLPRGRAR